MKTWDTHALSPNQRFEYWRDVLCEAFTALDSKPRDRCDLGSTVTLHELAHVNAADLSSFAQHVTRGRAEIRRRPDAFYFANFQLEGDCHVEQDGRRIRARPGSFYLVDTTRPYSLGFTDAFRALSFRFPHHQLSPLLGDPRRFTATLVEATDPLGGLASAHMSGILHCAEDLTPAAAGTLAGTLANLVSIAVTGPAVAGDAARHDARCAFRESIVRYVRSQIGNPALSVVAVARRFGVSPRTVHGVFREQPASFAQTVLEYRLEAAARALARSSARVTDVALACGFGDLSYFGRAFRRRYGCTPRGWQREPANRATPWRQPD